jgi:DNA-binding CsgD family transcriptional regulator
MAFYKRTPISPEIKAEQSYILSWSKKLKAVEMLGGCCEICKNTNLECLTFHHKDKKTKEIKISIATSRRWSVLEKEILKCKVLCMNCHRELHANEADAKNYYNNIRDINKSLLLLAKGESVCNICGYNKCISSLDFHHVTLGTKEFKLSDIVVNKKYTTIEDIEPFVLDELQKCQVLCANCHQTVHHNKETFNKYYDKIIEKKNSIIELSKPYDKNEIYNLYIEGMKQIDIAKKLGASKGTISEILKTFNIKKIEIIIDDNKFLELHNQGLSKTELTKALNTRINIINKYYKKYNLRANKKEIPKINIVDNPKYNVDGIMRLHFDGKSLREIGDIYKISYNTVRNIILHYKLKNKL